ncbi:hypothetical protein CL621_00580 [archaeon]|nr:hypothetical protein [archaeon]|tara:strand:- start:1704 stop:1928 length:225 start_codon:yes stop_codon:yes gene_type:complete
MLIGEIASILAPKTGYCYYLIIKISDAGKETKESVEKRVQEVFEDDRKRVLPVYNAKGKLIGYDQYGRHFDIKG